MNKTVILLFMIIALVGCATTPTMESEKEKYINGTSLTNRFSPELKAQIWDKALEKVDGDFQNPMFRKWLDTIELREEDKAFAEKRNKEKNEYITSWSNDYQKAGGDPGTLLSLGEPDRFNLVSSMVKKYSYKSCVLELPGTKDEKSARWSNYHSLWQELFNYEVANYYGQFNILEQNRIKEWANDLQVTFLKEYLEYTSNTK